MKSPSAKILVPLAVELAFALIVGVAIVATDGGRYGLGAEAAWDRLVERYSSCRTYSATIVHVRGEYPRLTEFHSEEKGRSIFELCPGGSLYVLLYKAPWRFAGTISAVGDMRRSFWIAMRGSPWLIEPSAWMDLDENEVVMGVAYYGPQWDPPLVYRLLLTHGSPGLVGWTQVVHVDGPEGDSATWDMSDARWEPVLYIERERRRGRDGGLWDVLVVHSKGSKREVWIDPADGGIGAVVWPRPENAWTELYLDAAFDVPIEDALFEPTDEGIERLKQWIAEREKEPTK